MPNEAAVDEQDILREAEAKTRTWRRNHGLDPETGRPLAPPAATASAIVSAGAPVQHDVRLARHETPQGLGDVLGVAPPTGHFACSDKLENRRRCGALIDRPGVCLNCAKRREARERASTIRKRVATYLPEIHRDVTWETLPHLRNETGERPRVQLPPRRMEEIRRCMETERRVVLVGSSGSGKSTLASAYIRDAIERGSERARFILSMELEETDEGESMYAHAIGAETLVLDDVGAELHGAPAESGLAAQRIRLVDKILAIRFQRMRRTVVTTPHDKTTFNNVYGYGIGRRVFDGAIIIRIDKGDGPR